MKPLQSLGQISDTFEEHSDYTDEENISEERRVFNWGGLFALLFFILIIAQLFILQVQEGFINLKLAEGNRIKNIPVSAPRGIIVDEKGELLATNEPTFELIVRASRKKDIDDVPPSVFEIVGFSKDDVAQKIETNHTQSGFVVLKDRIPKDDALLLESRLPAYGRFEVVPTFIRHYSENLSHVLGYVGKIAEGEGQDKPAVLVNGIIGKSGLEKIYDDTLQGVPGYQRAEVNAKGELIRLLSSVEPKVGNTLQISINYDLQNFVSGLLSNKAQELKTKGSIVVMNPKDGSIIALANFPTFDNNQFASGLSHDDYEKIANDPSNPLLNRAVSGEYPSGSSIKPFIAAAALESGIVDESLAFDTPPYIEVGQQKFPDWKDHGVTDIRRAIAESNNVFFYALGGGWGPIKKGLGPDGIKKGLDKFGFGKKTGVDLTGESNGFIPTSDWKKKKTGEPWFIGDTYNLSIGQGGFLVTPLQLANATCAIANGGKLFKPHFAQKILDPTGNIIKEFKEDDFLVAKDIYSAHSLQVVREGMRQTVEPGGSAYSVFGNSFPLEVAGKTGTAQFGNEGKTHSWFTSFAPYNNPEIEVTVLVEGGGEGYQTAAPLAREIYRWWADNKK